MASITFSGGINNAHRVQLWAKELWHTHQRDQFFTGDPLFGKTSNFCVQLKADFTKQAGFQMTEGLIMPFVGAGILNDEKLEDSEEAPDFHTMTWQISQIRNAGRFAGRETQQMVNYDLPVEIKDGLGDWMSKRRDEDIFTVIASSCTKIFYANSRANSAAVVAGDYMILSNWVRAHAYAKSTADPKIPPIKISNIGQKTVYRYIGVMHDHVAYDLRINDATYITITQVADPRGDTNRLFSGALIDWQGMVLFEHPNCTIFTGWGAGGDVYGAESYLLGRQAAVVGIGGYRIEGMTDGYLKVVEEKFDLTNVVPDDYEIELRKAA